MYLPASFKVVDDEAIESFVQRYEFATLVSAVPALMVTHIPVTVTRTEAGLVITGHVARANTHWTLMDGASESLVIFHGPHAYVSPTWYAIRPAVPTWNYAVVHAYGRPRANQDPAFLEAQLRELVRRHESGRDPQFRFDDLPADHRTRLLAGIVGFEMPVERIEAKFKINQNRPAVDRHAAIGGLERESSAEAQSMAAFMREHLGI